MTPPWKAGSTAFPKNRFRRPDSQRDYDFTRRIARSVALNFPVSEDLIHKGIMTKRLSAVVPAFEVMFPKT